MGRSFSVYLFCLAMDPVFHYLNQIPGVISVQGYVDDTTIIGLTEDATWLRKVSTCYGRLRSAGFVVDGHSCYRSCLNSCMKYAARVVSGDELLQYWPEVDCARGYPTATAALEHTAVRGYSVLVLRLFGSGGKYGGILVNLSFQQVNWKYARGEIMLQCSLCGLSLARAKASAPLSPIVYFVLWRYLH